MNRTDVNQNSHSIPAKESRTMLFLAGLVACFGFAAAACSPGDPGEDAQAAASSSSSAQVGASDDDAPALSSDAEAPAEADTAEANALTESSVKVFTEEEAAEKRAEAASAVDTETLTATGDGFEGEDLEAFIAARYEAFWTAYDAARSVPGTEALNDFPALANLASGEQLDNSYSSIDELGNRGEAIREPATPAIDGTDSDSEHRVVVTLIDDALAEVTGCAVYDDIRVNTATGEVISGTVRTIESKSTMVRADGTWKLIRSNAIDIQDGVGGCWDGAADSY